jgi:hypothetical protein
MSLEKIELRAAGMHEVGVRMDDLLDAARKEVLRCEGAQLGLLQATKGVIDLIAYVDKDVDEGKYGLEAAKLIKLYLSRASEVVQNLSKNANNQKIAATGQVQMAEVAVQITKKMHDGELAKRAAVAAAEATPEDVTLRTRPEGVHPPATIKEQRLAEDTLNAGATGTSKGRRRKL